MPQVKPRGRPGHRHLDNRRNSFNGDFWSCENQPKRQTLTPPGGGCGGRDPRGGGTPTNVHLVLPPFLEKNHGCNLAYSTGL